MLPLPPRSTLFPYTTLFRSCLWKPLRKLMAKARAAREKELALERASQALKNGGVLYHDFPQLIDRLSSDPARSEEHTSELQSPMYLVCRLLLEKKKINR